MRDDLLDAQASIDWAISQREVLVGRITHWRRARPYIAVTEPDSDPSKEMVKAKLRTPLPLVINAEAGAIVHMIRSSLDILTVALAERNGNVRPKDVYFPIADSKTAFFHGKNAAVKKIAQLSDSDR